MPDQIFISYRRDDAAYVTGHINDLLRKAFGHGSVFTDVDNIALGVDFRAVLDESVSRCQVLLAVIGDNWLAATNQDGTRRLRDPADFVRIEIESALRRNIPVIPLLVGRATMPKADELPDSLKDLAFRNGTPIRPAPDFNADMERLIRNLRTYLKTVRADADVGRADDAGTDEFPADEQHAAQPAPQGDTVSRGQMLVEADDRARRRVGLNMDPAPRKRWHTPLWLVAIAAVAGTSWYYVDRNPETVEAVIGAVRSAGSAADLRAAGNADPAATTGNLPTQGVGAPTSFSAVGRAPAEDGQQAAPGATTGVVETGEPQGADAAPVPTSTAGPPEELAEPLADNSGGAPVAVSEAATEASPQESRDQVPAGAGDVANAAGGGMADGEVVLTPGTQRQASASEYISEGVSLAAIGDHEAAIGNFDQAIELDVEPAFVHKQRGASYRALGQYEAAIRDYGEAIRLNREDLNAYYNRAGSHMALGNYAAAVEDFGEVIRLDPEFADAYARRADAHEALGNVAQAAQDRSTAAVFESNRDRRPR